MPTRAIIWRFRNRQGCYGSWLPFLPNTVHQAIHSRAEVAPKAGRREAVILAAPLAPRSISGELTTGSQFAATPTRSRSSNPARVMSSEPVASSARVQTSERTTPQEGRCIRLTMDRATNQAAINTRKESSIMNTWQQITHFAGFDWAKDHHDLLVLDGNAKVVARLRFDHSAEGWQRCREQLAAFPKVAVAVEGGNTMAIEQLLASGCLIFNIHPRSSKSYRQRRQPTGNKTDDIDCRPWPPPCAWKDRTGNPWPQPIRTSKSCDCYAAMKCCSSSSARRW